MKKSLLLLTILALPICVHTALRDRTPMPASTVAVETAGPAAAGETAAPAPPTAPDVMPAPVAMPPAPAASRDSLWQNPSAMIAPMAAFHTWTELPKNE